MEQSIIKGCFGSGSGHGPQVTVRTEMFAISPITVKIEFSGLDMSVNPPIPPQSIALVHIKTALNHYLSRSWAGEMLRRILHFFLSGALAGDSCSRCQRGVFAAIHSCSRAVFLTRQLADII